mmetsp:Transcript_29255/g.94376  ORF Transcript_29255/g.94376 Transcript_29255/m.94376 type:complete len:245 (+) Transcript_29255:54-788(+)
MRLFAVVALVVVRSWALQAGGGGKVDATRRALSLSPLLAPALVSATDLAKFNKRLTGLGIEEVASIPEGFNAAVESYTQSSPKLWVEFFYPNTWIFVKPSQNTNGESGTLSAGDYGKGDSCALFVGQGAKALSDKTFLTKTLISGIAQKGDNQYQNFELGKVAKPNDNYVLAEFTYELLTGAGFVVERKGVASVTTVGDAVPALIAVTTAARYKKIGDKLKTATASFKAYEKASTMATMPNDDV